MKNLVNDGLRTSGVLGVLMGMAVACGSASTTNGSEPAKSTAAVPASSGGAAPASSAAAGAPDREQIQAVLKNHSRELKACYDREKDRGMAYKGDTKFRVKLEASGKVAEVQGVDVVPPAEFLSSCVGESMKGWTFPSSSTGGSVTFAVPW
jgi:hypothetical protein